MIKFFKLQSFCLILNPNIFKMENEKIKVVASILIFCGFGLIMIIDHTDASKDVLGMDWKTQRKLGAMSMAIGGATLAITSLLSLKK